MERTLEQTVAANLTELRRAKGWTQADLAQKINYSDKSVSKWERGDGLPDLKVLCRLAELFGVTLDELVTHKGATEALERKRPARNITPRVITELLALSVIFLVATVFYVGFASAQKNLWTVFVWAIPVAFGLLTVLNVMWKWRVCAIVFASVAAWGLLAAVYLQILQHNLWMIFLVGVPAQAAIILGAQLRAKKQQRKESTSHEQSTAEC